MREGNARYPGNAPWSVEAIPYHTLERERVKDDVLLLYVVAAASFVEITADVYTRYIADYFRGDAEVVGWLERAWDSEEMQHGQALRRYVETAWPHFDWERAYQGFLGDFMRYCSIEQLEATRALEMAARCVVETGTATLYRTLADASPEPVLHQIAAAISADEVRHYKHFYHFFLRYRERERPSRAAVARTIWRRMREVETEDAYFAFKHVYLTHNRGAAFAEADYTAYRAQLRPFAARHFPYRMASKMLLKPLGLAGPLSRLATPALASVSRLLLLA